MSPIMDAAVEIRAAVAADVPELNPILFASGELFPDGRIPLPIDPLPSRVFEKSLAEDLLLVAAAADLIVGFALNEILAGYLHLEQLSVVPAHGRRGIGRALVLRVIELCVQSSLPGVTLTTFRDLPWNGPFYAKLGFREIAEDDLSDELRSILRREHLQGMTQRIAMKYGP